MTGRASELLREISKLIKEYESKAETFVACDIVLPVYRVPYLTWNGEKFVSKGSI